MSTEKIYQKNVYEKECQSKIISITGEGSSENPYVIVLDRTIFFPEGGGQPCDTGNIEELSVIDVHEKDLIIYHTAVRGSGSSSVLVEGSAVKCILNWEKRFYNMQRHCGEHILSGIFFQECGGVNRGFHMGASYMTIDIDATNLSQDLIERIEFLANKVIWANLPVTTRHFEKKEEAEGLPLRKALAIDEEITIVCVGSEGNPADCVACCGTHPSSSGQVGAIKILKVENYKGMSRVYFKAGEEAYYDYKLKHEIISQLSKKYSADERDLLEKIKVQEEKNKAVRTELHKIKASLLSIYTQDIAEAYESANYYKEGNAELLIKEYSDLQVDDLINLGRSAKPYIKGLLILVSPVDFTVLLFSNGNPDCGKLVKENAHIYSGKGGGNATNARALFSKKEYAETFIDLLKNHLR